MRVFSRGCLSAQHDLLLFANTDSGKNAGFTLLVRARSAAANDLLQDTFYAAGFSSRTGGPLACDTGQAVLDGAGGGQWTRAYNWYGVPEVTSSALGYTVAPDGSATFTLDDTLEAAAAAGPDGRYVVWGGYVTAGSTPMLGILWR